MFASRFRDAMFTINLDDLEDVKRQLKAKGEECTPAASNSGFLLTTRYYSSRIIITGMSDEDVQKKLRDDYSYFLARVRRRVPPPKQLYQRLSLLFDVYSDILDHRTGEPLFSSKATKEWHNLLKHVLRGCLSDDPSVPLYYSRSQSAEGGRASSSSSIPRLGCCRGTPDVGE